MEQAIRDLVRKRASERCEYCRLPQSAMPFAPFHVEHIVAQQHFGSDDVSNLAFSCDRCNLYKGPNLSSIDPDTGEVVPLFHPRKDRWDDHFQMRDAHISGLTAKGRATARLLNMNARQRVRLRKELDSQGAV